MALTKAPSPRPSHARPPAPHRRSDAGVRAGLAGLALAGAAALLVASFTAVVAVRVPHYGTLTDSGLDRHGPALILLALAAGVLAVLAYGGARAAAVALALVGVVALAIAIAGDITDLNQTVRAGPAAAPATSSAGVGFFLETLGGVLVLLAGLGLWLTPPARSAAQAPPDWDPGDRPDAQAIAPRQT